MKKKKSPFEDDDLSHYSFEPINKENLLGHLKKLYR